MVLRWHGIRILCGVLGSVCFFKRAWRHAYFQFLGDKKDWAYVVVAIKLKWLHQKLGTYHAVGKEKSRVVLLLVKLIFSRIICSCFCRGYMKFS